MNSLNRTVADFNGHIQENLSCLIPVNLSLKISVGPPNCYVLKSSTINAAQARFAVALSNNQVKIYDQCGSLCENFEQDSSVSHLKFSSTNPDILFTSSLDGKIQVWDLRSQHCVQIFYDDSDGFLKPILCFDYNHDEEIICAGTELIREDAFHLFWDRRSSKILGGYWNSHADDITQIHFHPYHASWMVSSSLDALINVFNLNETSEEDALMDTINVEAPVNTFTWKSEDTLSCTTGIEEHHLIKTETAQSMLSTSREKLLKDFQIRADCMIDSLPIKESFFLATGKNSGELHLWQIDENSLYPNKSSSAGYILKGHTDVVRTVSYNESTDVLLTGGDDGCVCLWKLHPDRKSLHQNSR